MAYEKIQCKIKTFEASTVKGIEDFHNEFMKDHDIKFTQTHVKVLGTGALWYIIIEFYA